MTDLTGAPDLDYESIDGIDDEEEESVLAFVLNRTSGQYEWHWIPREYVAGFLGDERY